MLPQLPRTHTSPISHPNRLKPLHATPASAHPACPHPRRSPVSLARTTLPSFFSSNLTASFLFLELQSLLSFNGATLPPFPPRTTLPSFFPLNYAPPPLFSCPSFPARQQVPATFMLSPRTAKALPRSSHLQQGSDLQPSLSLPPACPLASARLLMLPHCTLHHVERVRPWLPVSSQARAVRRVTRRNLVWRAGPPTRPAQALHPGRSPLGGGAEPAQAAR